MSFEVGDIIDFRASFSSGSGVHYCFGKVVKITPAGSLHVNHLETELSDVFQSGTGGGEITKPKEPFVTTGFKSLLRPKKGYEDDNGYSIQGELYYVGIYDPKYVYRNESYL